MTNYFNLNLFDPLYYVVYAAADLLRLRFYAVAERNEQRHAALIPIDA